MPSFRLLYNMVLLGRLERAHLNGSVKRRSTSESPQVLDRVLFDQLWLNAQLGPRFDSFSVNTDSVLDTFSSRCLPTCRNTSVVDLGARVLVINVLSLNLVRRDGGPPKSPVDDFGKSHSDRLGQVGSVVRLEGQGGHEFDKVCVSVRLRTRQDESRTDGSPGCRKHDAESLGDVEDVRRSRSSGSVVDVEEGGVGYQVKGGGGWQSDTNSAENKSRGVTHMQLHSTTNPRYQTRLRDEQSSPLLQTPP